MSKTISKKTRQLSIKHLFSLQVATLLFIPFSTAFSAGELTDNVAPEITLNGSRSMTIEAGNQRYRDAGVTTTDNTKDAVSVSTLSDVDTTKAGVYSVSYVATDSSGNQAKATRSVEVTDTTAPIISLNGDTQVVIKTGDNYTDAGVSVVDNSSGNIGITSNISINTQVPGEYSVDYIATDASGNKASISRKVVVAALDEKPTISNSENNNSDALEDNRLTGLQSVGNITDSNPTTTLNNNNAVSVDGDSSVNLNTTANQPTEQPTKGSGGSLSLYWSLLLSILFLIRERKHLLRNAQ